MNNIVDEYCHLYFNWKQTHYSQPIYEKLVSLHSQMTPEEKAEASKKLVSKHNKTLTDHES